VHAALVYHKHLNLTYLTDLGSTHGTYIGSIRLEGHKPTVVQIGSVFHFGASTRNYTLRERPKTTQSIVEDIPMNENTGLPETQDEVDNLTEYNTANNRKISTLGITETFPAKKAGKRKRVTFNEDEIIINPEDVDPSIGRFRNLVQSTVVPVTNKRMRVDSNSSFSFPTSDQKILHHHSIIAPSLYAGLPSTSGDVHHAAGEHHLEDSAAFGMYSVKLLPNPAPDIEVTKPTAVPTVVFKHPASHPHSDHHESLDFDLNEPKKKKYAKESWPKRAPKHLGAI